MKKFFTFLLTILFLYHISQAQTAMDFTMNDCNGLMHNCYTTLDSGHVIVIEFFMTCNMCINAGHEIEGMKEQLDQLYPGKIHFYQMGYTNSYSCTSVLNWINANGFNSVPFDSGATLVAYYGGFGMPTVAVIAGSAHETLFSEVGYTNGDSAAISSAIHSFFNSTVVNELPANLNTLNVFPNPTASQFNVDLDLKQSEEVTIELLALNGEKVELLANEKMDAGHIRKTFTAASFKSGLYLVKFTVNGISTFDKLSISR